MTLSYRGLITPTLKALEKRMTICMLTIHKLPHNLVNLITRLDIFGVYIQPHFISCLVALVFIPKTTIYAFYIHFLTALKKVAGLPTQKKIRALNKIYHFDRIQDA